MKYQIIKYKKIGLIKDKPNYMKFLTLIDIENETWIHLFFGLIIKIRN